MGKTHRLPRVYLVRHGETEWSKSGQHTGKTDLPLTEFGVKLLETTASEFTGSGKLLCPKTIHRILVSPRQRAQKTLQLISGASDVPLLDNPKIKVETTEEVAEYDYGDYEGLTTKQIQEKVPNWSSRTHGCPGGESVEEHTARVDRVVKSIVDCQTDFVRRYRSNELDPDEHGADVLIVSHGDFTKSFLARWSRFDITSASSLVCDPGSINVCGYQHQRVNETSLLGLNLHSYLL